MAVKYQILFKDKRNNDCSVKFDFADYSGTDIMTLTGSGTPVTLTDNGANADLFTPIITSKAVVQVLVNQSTQQFVSDVRDIDDKQVFVTINYGKNKKWIGNLISDQNYEKFDVTGYFMSLTCVDPFSYLKQNARKILSTTTMYGTQSIYDFITAIMAESAPGIEIKLINNYLPVISGATDLLKDCYVVVETFMQDGVFPDGYTIMQNLMTSLCMTCMVVNGILYLINHRSNIGNNQKEVGIKPLGATDYLLSNSEIITRTRGTKKLGTSFNYGDLGSYLNNGYFYYYNPDATTGSEITGWSYGTLLSSTSIERVGAGDSDNPYGVRFIGNWSPSSETRSAVLSSPINIDGHIEDAGTAHRNLFKLELKYRYAPYTKASSAPLYYTFQLYANVDGDDTTLTYDYTGNGGDTSTGKWYNASLGYGIKFPLGTSNAQNTFSLLVQTQNFGSDDGDMPASWRTKHIKFTIRLFGMESAVNGDYISDNAPIAPAYDITINSIKYYEANMLSINTDDYKTGNNYIYSKDETTISSDRNYSLVNDNVSVFLGMKYYNWDIDSEFIPYLLYPFSTGCIMDSTGAAIEKFQYGSDASTADKLVTLIAKDRMFFGRQPRYKVDCEIESDDLDMSDTIKFTHGKDELLPNTYTILSDELDVRMCKHHVLVQELTGSDDDTDTIQNYLGTD